MKFQIESLIVWPKSSQFAPRTVSFKLGMVNVITGASRTGKSAIIPIIDYCLASSDCFIPIDTIRDHASWYGVIIQTVSEKILFARKVPSGTRVSNEFYLLRGKKISIPGEIVESNEKASGIKNILNTLSSTPAFSLGEGDDKNFKARLSFRDLMAFLFQSQEIVANQNILFYKTHAHEHRERLRNWFPYILGAETIEILRARHRLRLAEVELGKSKREFDEIKASSDSWASNIRGHLNVADEYGLLIETLSSETKPDELLNIAKDILKHIPDQSNAGKKNIERANKDLSKLETKDEELSTALAIVKKRLGDLQRLRNSFSDYGGGVKKRTERLHISQWFRNVAGASGNCPACGSSEHPDSGDELEKICSAFEKYEADSKIVAEVPTSFDREEQILQTELDDLLKEKKRLSQQFDFLLAKDKEAQKEFQRGKEMFLFLGHLKASLELYERRKDGGNLDKVINDLEKECSELRRIINRDEIASKVDHATSRICQIALSHLQTLDAEEKYRKLPPRLSVTDLSVSVQSDDGNWHTLAEVGSASNWVSFHLAIMCGLQEYFLEKPNSVVPSFVIFDQPSQVYFPKLKRGEAEHKDPKYEDEDVSAVKSMFQTLASSISNSGGAWQAIVLDHADSDIYEGIAGVHEVEVWRKGTKLIPVEWDQDSGRR